MTSESQSTSGPNRVVVGVDGSHASLGALEWALHYASMSHATVDLVVAWDWPVNVSLAPIAPGYAPAMNAEQLLDCLIREKRAQHPDLKIDGHVVQGDAASVLEEASHEAALLVVATRGHGGLAGLLLGSVSEHCATHAPCPVVVYRSDPGSSKLDDADL